jgi:hypothetical protein
MRCRRESPGCRTWTAVSIAADGACWARCITYHFSATMPFAVSPRIYSLPFPTRPKLADDATAMRESKKGEYLTLYPLKPWVRNSSMVALCFRGDECEVQSGSHAMSRGESKAEGASLPMERRSCWACPAWLRTGRAEAGFRWWGSLRAPSTGHLGHQSTCNSTRSRQGVRVLHRD